MVVNKLAAERAFQRKNPPPAAAGSPSDGKPSPGWKSLTSPSLINPVR
jgi:hypothetical protein